jgi:glycosyltransferase involved in cell wall biosynthesis
VRILQIIQRPQLRGAEIFAAQLSQHLRSMGHDVKIVALMDGDAKLSFDDVTTLSLPLNNRLTDLAGWRKLASAIENFKPDIVQANAGDTLKYAALSKLMFRWHGRLIFRNANKVSEFVTSRAKFLFNKFLLKQISHVISVSEICRLDFIDTYKVNKSRVTTIPIGIERRDTAIDFAADLKEIGGERPIALNVASLVPEKNQDALIRLAKHLRDTGSDMLILIVGDGKLRSTLEERIREAGVEKQISLLGYRNDVPAPMCTAHLLIVPSLVEGLPGVILEAFNYRLPVVAYDVGGIGEVVMNDATGWLVQKNDETGLLDAMSEVLQHPEKVKRIVDNANKLVNTYYLNSGVARKFAEVYAKIS